ncbi:hypothetical protein SAMN05660860_01716 [Geoalkalibacter ferrihydriticus]|uniref:Lipoprotein n=2 Tax=Geoalkalibacter ferrihydriticus TaxID=392333 RepID=A0A0C2DT03_9BACT|nr:hypothetical protein [Geoalkalibacter ferrihydriticus]KIH76584.1 hypothetical protein GFER_10495 [Geoalkalibacter ferrihydriticus DSM 17813]SDM02454.1 hypothetical protein SAMN05660860_01716 [Geoalkalibacter ferrihydriticus]
MKTLIKNLALVFAVVVASAACTPYKSQEVGFRVPSANPNMQVIGGAQVAAEAYRDKSAARAAFGFDIVSAGIQPVQVVIDNQGGSALRIVPEQTFLIDDQGYMWNILDSRAAYERVEKSGEYARIARGAGRGGMLGAAGGALVGAAIGVVSGENVASAAGKGAALGGAGGAVIGGGHELGSDEAGREISRDLSNKELRNRPVGPGFLGRGFLFFPAEAGQPRQLRLQMYDIDSGEVHTRTFAL